MSINPNEEADMTEICKVYLKKMREEKLQGVIREICRGYFSGLANRHFKVLLEPNFERECLQVMSSLAK